MEMKLTSLLVKIDFILSYLHLPMFIKLNQS